MHTKEFKVGSIHQAVQKKLQGLVRVIYTRGKVKDPSIITQALVETFDCSNSHEADVCLGRGTTLNIDELRQVGIDLMRVKRVFCRIYPPQLRTLHIEGAVHAELEQITQERQVR